MYTVRTHWEFLNFSYKRKTVTINKERVTEMRKAAEVCVEVKEEMVEVTAKEEKVEVKEEDKVEEAAEVEAEAVEVWEPEEVVAALVEEEVEVPEVLPPKWVANFCQLGVPNPVTGSHPEPK
jgi:hypothetical protein